MISTDHYMFKTYNAATYNCAHLVCDVWKDLTGRDLKPALLGMMSGAGHRKVSIEELRIFKKLDEPVDPCVALFQSRRLGSHVGVYMRGRVLHINPRGVEFQPVNVVKVNFSDVRFYTC